MRLTRILAAGLLTLALSGCYLTRSEVISAQQAQAVPNLAGNYVPASEEADPTQVTIAQGDGNDYLYTQTDGQETQSLLLRALPLTGALFMGQLSDPSGQTTEAVIVFFEVQPAGIAISVPEADTSALAQQFGVALVGEERVLEGDPSAIQSFIEAHAEVPMSPPELLLARQ